MNTNFEITDLYVLVAGLATIILTELIKLPIKKACGDKPLANYLYIFISLIVTAGGYIAYLYIKERTIVWTDWQPLVAGLIAFVGIVQTIFNFIWKNGIKALLKKIHPACNKIPDEITNKVDNLITESTGQELSASEQLLKKAEAEAKKHVDRTKKDGKYDNV